MKRWNTRNAEMQAPVFRAIQVRILHFSLSLWCGIRPSSQKSLYGWVTLRMEYLINQSSKKKNPFSKTNQINWNQWHHSSWMFFKYSENLVAVLSFISFCAILPQVLFYSNFNLLKFASRLYWIDMIDVLYLDRHWIFFTSLRKMHGLPPGLPWTWSSSYILEDLKKAITIPIFLGGLNQTLIKKLKKW